MKRFALLLSFGIVLSLLFNSCNSSDKKSSSTNDHDVPLGMKFEPEEKLAGIPLASTPFGGDELPASVDLSDRMPPVGNQGNQQS